jgi:hypothetical protein
MFVVIAQPSRRGLQGLCGANLQHPCRVAGVPLGAARLSIAASTLVRRDLARPDPFSACLASNPFGTPNARSTLDCRS